MTALTKHEPRSASFDEMRTFASVAVKSRFYGFKSEEEMLPLMIIAQSQGRSFTSVVEEYSVINGRPALKAESMLARFQKAGGHIQWTELSDTRCAAIFSHPQCAPVEVDWDLDRAKAAGLSGRDMWRKFPRNMLKARVISDGVRTAYPACLGGVYTPEEIGDMEPAHVSPPMSRGQLAAPEEPGQVETPREPPSSSNVPGGVKSVKDFAQEEALTQKDYSTEAEWEELLSEMETHATREDVTAWWKSKRELKQSKPHMMRAFSHFALTPYWESLSETVVWDEAEAGARG